MTRRWVANASPLILLGKVGQLGLLAELADEVVIPEMVAREVSAKPDGKQAIDELSRTSGVRLEPDRLVSKVIEAWDLGPGESQVLAVSDGGPGARAVLDDLEARRCAASIDVPVIGTLGVVLRAKRKGIVPAARPVLQRLRHEGLYVSTDLLEKALEHLDE